MAEIQQRLEETLGTDTRMLKNTNSVLLSMLATTLGRYDILRSHVDNLTRSLRRKLVEIQAPLTDLQSLYLCRDKREDVFK